MNCLPYSLLGKEEAYTLFTSKYDTLPLLIISLRKKDGMLPIRAGASLAGDGTAKEETVRKESRPLEGSQRRELSIGVEAKLSIESMQTKVAVDLAIPDQAGDVNEADKCYDHQNKAHSTENASAVDNSSGKEEPVRHSQHISQHEQATASSGSAQKLSVQVKRNRRNCNSLETIWQTNPKVRFNEGWQREGWLLDHEHHDENPLALSRDRMADNHLSIYYIRRDTVLRVIWKRPKTVCTERAPALLSTARCLSDLSPKNSFMITCPDPLNVKTLTKGVVLLPAKSTSLYKRSSTSDVVVYGKESIDKRSAFCSINFLSGASINTAFEEEIPEQEASAGNSLCDAHTTMGSRGAIRFLGDMTVSDTVIEIPTSADCFHEIIAATHAHVAADPSPLVLSVHSWTSDLPHEGAAKSFDDMDELQPLQIVAATTGGSSTRIRSVDLLADVVDVASKQPMNNDFLSFLEPNSAEAGGSTGSSSTGQFQTLHQMERQEGVAESDTESISELEANLKCDDGHAEPPGVMLALSSSDSMLGQELWIPSVRYRGASETNALASEARAAERISKESLRATGKLELMLKHGNLANPITFPLGQGDGMNKEVRPDRVLRRGRATIRTRSFEWERPHWTTRHTQLKVTGSGPLIKEGGNLAKPITFPPGKGDGLNKLAQPQDVLRRTAHVRLEENERFRDDAFQFRVQD